MINSVIFAKSRAVLVAVAFAAMPGSTAVADEMRTFKKTGVPYEDVKMDVEMAIEHKGLKIGAIGDLGDMLARTQSDIAKGDTATYKAAHYYQFCSAVLSHKLAKADPMNIGHCPFLVFSYETLAKPGEIVVGYRTITRSGSPETRAVLDEVEATLDNIARSATE